MNDDLIYGLAMLLMGLMAGFCLGLEFMDTKLGRRILLKTPRDEETKAPSGVGEKET